MPNTGCLIHLNEKLLYAIKIVFFSLSLNSPFEITSISKSLSKINFFEISTCRGVQDSVIIEICPTEHITAWNGIWKIQGDK